MTISTTTTPMTMDMAKVLALLAIGRFTTTEAAQLMEWPPGAVAELVRRQPGWLRAEDGRVVAPGRCDGQVQLPEGFPHDVEAWAGAVRRGEIPACADPAQKAPSATRGEEGAASRAKPSGDAPTTNAEGRPRFAVIALDKIRVNPANVRKKIGDVTELADSIKEHGVLQPVVVREVSVDGHQHFELVMGERRYTAARAAGEATIVARVSEAVNAPRTIVQMLTENLQREDLNAMDKAEAFGVLRDIHQYSVTQIARETGLAQGTISTSLALLDLDDKTRKRVRSGSLAVRDALDLVRRFRAKERKERGHKPARVTWERDHFTDEHPLAEQARQRCNDNDHTARRRLKGTACGQCWEATIRAAANRAEERHSEAPTRLDGHPVSAQAAVPPQRAAASVPSAGRGQQTPAPAITVQMIAEQALTLCRLLGPPRRHISADLGAAGLAADIYHHAADAYHEALRHLGIPADRVRDVADLTESGRMSIADACTRFAQRVREEVR